MTDAKMVSLDNAITYVAEKLADGNEKAREVFERRKEISEQFPQYVQYAESIGLTREVMQPLEAPED